MKKAFEKKQNVREDFYLDDVLQSFAYRRRFIYEFYINTMNRKVSVNVDSNGEFYAECRARSIRGYTFDEIFAAEVE